MSAPATTKVTTIATMRYRDARAAIDWLCRAFGFERHFVVDDADGGIAHAQLVFGNGMIMLGQARSDESGFDELVKPPGSSGINSHSLYVVVEEVDSHCERARAAGATIVDEPCDQEYGGRLYTCRDCEGHVWNFGSYDPWQ